MVSSREDLKQYALRALGAPVLEINVDDDQLEDRIEEALSYWHLYHYDGIEKVYLKQRINASTVTITGTNAQDFAIGSILICKNETDAVVATVRVVTDPEFPATETTFSVLFTDRDKVELASTITTITDGTNTAIVHSFVVGEMDKRYLDIPDHVYGVVRVLPFAGVNTSRSLFDIQYQLRLHDLYDLTSTSIIYYTMVMSHLSLLDLELNGKPLFRFNRLQGRLYIDTNWDSNLAVGHYVIVDCYRALDPTVFSKVWDEIWLKHYVTALFKRQWAVNLKKFAGMILPGGVQLDGVGMYREALGEIQELENDLMTKAAPLDFYMG